MGRGFIDRFEVARSALAAAESRMEFLSALRSWSPELMIGDHPAIPNPFVFGNPARTIGTETWRVEWFDDPVTPGTIQDLKRVTVVVRWTMAGDRRLRDLHPAVRALMRTPRPEGPHPDRDHGRHGAREHRHARSRRLLHELAGDLDRCGRQGGHPARGHRTAREHRPAHPRRGSALATNPDGNPDHAQLDLFAQPSQQNQFYSFWWDAADSRVHEGPSRTQDRGASVTSTVERFNLFTTDSMVVLNSLVLRSPQGERVRLFTNVALLNR